MGGAPVYRIETDLGFRTEEQQSLKSSHSEAILN